MSYGFDTKIDIGAVASATAKANKDPRRKPQNPLGDVAEGVQAFASAQNLGSVGAAALQLVAPGLFSPPQRVADSSVVKDENLPPAEVKEALSGEAAPGRVVNVVDHP